MVPEPNLNTRQADSHVIYTVIKAARLVYNLTNKVSMRAVRGIAQCAETTPTLKNR